MHKGCQGLIQSESSGDIVFPFVAERANEVHGAIYEGIKSNCVAPGYFFVAHPPPRR